MLHIPDRALPPEAVAFLNRLQSTVDAKATHSDRIDTAKKLFNGRHTTYKRLFQPVASLLSDMAPPYRRCYYCEDSELRDVEHIKPKRHYPDLCFRWINYAFACTICNGAKSDTVALFKGASDQFDTYGRKHPKHLTLPVADPVLIDPRTEDPLAFIKLDILTGNLVPLAANGRPHIRARHTIDLLRLNRDAVSRTRRSMVVSYLNYLKLYKKYRDENDANCTRVLTELSKLPQPTVFVELKRQKNDHPGLSALIDILPPGI